MSQPTPATADRRPIGEEPLLGPSSPWWGLGFLVAVPVLAHMLFSSLGFNPTDDGYVLAYSRRLLEGQLPHADFLSIHPLGSPLLHLPVVAAGGTATFWWSRLVVWAEYAATAWIWTRVVSRERPMPGPAQVATAVVAFVLGVHTFPVMAWNSTDALLLASLGLLLATRPDARWTASGYVLLGASALARQNFAIVGPLALLALGQWRRPRLWVAWVAPGALYLAVSVAAAGLWSVLEQLASQRDLLQPGLLTYVRSGWMQLGVLAGAVIAAPMLLPVVSPALAAASATAAGLVLAAAGIGIYDGSYAFGASFLLFGATLVPVTAAVFTWSGEAARGARIAAIGIAIAWVVSISNGYSTPALAGAILAPVLIGWSWLRVPIHARLRLITLGVAASLLLGGLWVARTSYLYREASVEALTEPLGGVFPGAAHLRTNTLTHAFLVDLERAIEQVDGPYAIVPQLAAYWVEAGAVNPLPFDWTATPELIHDEALFAGLTEAIDRQRGELTIIVQRYDLQAIPNLTETPTTEPDATIVGYVRGTMEKIGETQFYELYR